MLRSLCKAEEVPRNIAGARFHLKGTGRGRNDVSVDYCKACYQNLVAAKSHTTTDFLRYYAKAATVPVGTAAKTPKSAVRKITLTHIHTLIQC